MRFHADGADKVVVTVEIGVKRLETGGQTWSFQA